MAFSPERAAIRFGTGLAPGIDPPGSAAAMLEALSGPDLAARAWPITPFAQAAPAIADLRAMNRTRREARGTDREATVEAAYQALIAQQRATRAAGFAATLARWVTTADGLRERLVAFWADHFTVRAKIGVLGHVITPYVEEAIRPHVTGRFADMLRAVVTHPAMIAYLDQSQSMGPNSAAAARNDRGLNENLARELLELHTLGVDGAYTQADVRELAELLTGLGWDGNAPVARYRPDFAEPGSETVLGVSYSPLADLWTVERALDDLAAHPATARHLAGRIAAHFVADDPPRDLVAALEADFLASGGDLASLVACLLDHPLAWDGPSVRVRPPFDFIAAALRALAVPPAAWAGLDARSFRRLFDLPLAVMGQPWEAPPGPDGWPEAAAAWVTPQFMAGRIDWAMRAPVALRPDLPDPRAFAPTALGAVPPEVAQAAAAAEDRVTGVAVVLASAAFNRR
ncbi:MAG: DUF1800 domain-containing protein [Rubellimicrobium sp.]|nr:DUF1800 domain-containing protein [Rubellimicrobium sp.]